MSQRLVWAFLSPPELTLCFSGLMFTCLGSLDLPSESWGLCALVSAHQPTLYIVGLVCSSFCSLGLPTVPLRVASQGASRAAPGKSGLHARGEGERVLALAGVLGTGLPGLGTEHLPGALCSGTGSPALGLCSP